jgi:hypothetical protein
VSNQEGVVQNPLGSEALQLFEFVNVTAAEVRFKFQSNQLRNPCLLHHQQHILLLLLLLLPLLLLLLLQEAAVASPVQSGPTAAAPTHPWGCSAMLHALMD